jgi:hypothetical protein
MTLSRLRNWWLASFLSVSAPCIASAAPPVAPPPTAAPNEAPCQETERQIHLEFRIVCVPKSCEAVEKHFPVPAPELRLAAATDAVATKTSGAILSGDESTTLLAALKADPRTTVLSAPRMALHIGESGHVQIGQQKSYLTGADVRLVDGLPIMSPKTEIVQLGMTLKVRGDVNCCGSGVKLAVDYQSKEQVGSSVLHPITSYVVPVVDGGSQGAPVPFTQFLEAAKFHTISAKGTGTVPAGSTLLLKLGTRPVEEVIEFGRASRIPYLNRLFKSRSVTVANCDVILLATPTLVSAPVSAKPVRETLPAPRSCEAPQTLKLEVRVTGGNTLLGQLLVPTSREPARIPHAVDGQVQAERSPELTRLLAAYRQACAEGKKDEATRLAVQALAIDATCFAK